MCVVERVKWREIQWRRSCGAVRSGWRTMPLSRRICMIKCAIPSTILVKRSHFWKFTNRSSSTLLNWISLPIAPKRRWSQHWMMQNYRVEKPSYHEQPTTATGTLRWLLLVSPNCTRRSHLFRHKSAPIIWVGVGWGFKAAKEANRAKIDVDVQDNSINPATEGWTREFRASKTKAIPTTNDRAEEAAIQAYWTTRCERMHGSLKHWIIYSTTKTADSQQYRAILKLIHLCKLMKEFVSSDEIGREINEAMQCESRRRGLLMMISITKTSNVPNICAVKRFKPS